MKGGFGSNPTIGILLELVNGLQETPLYLIPLLQKITNRLRDEQENETKANGSARFFRKEKAFMCLEDFIGALQEALGSTLSRMVVATALFYAYTRKGVKYEDAVSLFERLSDFVFSVFETEHASQRLSEIIDQYSIDIKN